MCVHSTLMRQSKDGAERLIVHLYSDLNTTAFHALPNDDVPLREEVVPIHDIRVTFAPGYRFGRVHLEPEGQDLKVVADARRAERGRPSAGHSLDGGGRARPGHPESNRSAPWSCGFSVDDRLLRALNRGDPIGDRGDLFGFDLDGEIEGHRVAGSRRQLGDAAEFAFDAAVVGKVGSRLDAGDVAVFLGGGVLPEGQIRELAVENRIDAPRLPALLRINGQGVPLAVGPWTEAVNLLDEAAGRRRRSGRSGSRPWPHAR